jgi:hypothetical protein
MHKIEPRDSMFSGECTPERSNSPNQIIIVASRNEFHARVPAAKFLDTIVGKAEREDCQLE